MQTDPLARSLARNLSAPEQQTADAAVTALQVAATSLL